jgi:hypothetical protein
VLFRADLRHVIAHLGFILNADQNSKTTTINMLNNRSIDIIQFIDHSDFKNDTTLSRNEFTGSLVNNELYEVVATKKSEGNLSQMVTPLFAGS